MKIIEIIKSINIIFISILIFLRINNTIKKAVTNKLTSCDKTLIMKKGIIKK